MHTNGPILLWYEDGIIFWSSHIRYDDDIRIEGVDSAADLEN